MPRIVPISYRVLVRILEADGFVFSRQHGSHLAYIKGGVARPVILPTYDAVPVFIIKNCLRTAKMSREHYFELLSVVS